MQEFTRSALQLIPTRRSWRWWGLVFAMTIISLIAVGLGIQQLASYLLGNQARKERVLSVAVEPVEQATGYDVPREYVGKVEAKRNSNLSFERTGLVVSVQLQEGASVRSHQLIASLDTQQLEARRSVLQARLARAQATLKELRDGPRKEVIATARADLARWQARHRLAALDAKRARQTFTRNAVAKSTWDEARLTEQSLQAQVDAARAQLEELLAGTRQEKIAAQAALVRQTKAEIESVEVDLAKSRLTAPYAGIIAARHIDEGEVITAGTPIVELVEMPHLRVRVGLSGLAAGALSVGQSVDVTIRAETRATQVTAIRPDRNPSTRTVTVLLSLPYSPPSVKVGDLATVTLSRRVEREGFWVPISALTEGKRGLWACYIAAPLAENSETHATHRIDSRPVELLSKTSDQAYVVGPLTEGELLVREGLHRLVPQQKVVLAEGEPL